MKALRATLMIMLRVPLSLWCKGSALGTPSDGLWVYGRVTHAGRR